MSLVGLNFFRQFKADPAALQSSVMSVWVGLVGGSKANSAESGHRESVGSSSRDLRDLEMQKNPLLSRSVK